MLETKALSTFHDNRYYEVLIGKSDFARSFITSEYLYKQYDCSDQFDYTAIISGYIKAVEQLLFHVCMLALDKGRQIKSKGGMKDSYGNRLSYKIDFTTKNLEEGLCDTTMGALSYLVKESKRLIFENKKHKICIYKCIQCFIRECRNDSFHKHNIKQWSRVEFIRKNALTIIILLLGLSKMDDKEQNLYKQLGLDVDDGMERAYYWISSIKADEFYISFGEESIKAKIGKTSGFPEFDNYGFIKDYMFILESAESGKESETEHLIIKRDRVPSRMWYFDENGDKILYENEHA